MKRPESVLKNQRGAAFLVLVVLVGMVAVIVNSSMLKSIQDTDTQRGEVKQALAAIEATEQLAVILRNSFDMAQAYPGSCPSGSTATTINGVRFCFSNATDGRCIKSPLDPTVNLCLNSTQVQLTRYDLDEGEKQSAFAKLEGFVPDLSKLPSRLLWEEAQATTPNRNLPDIVSPPSSSFPAPACPSGDPLCKTCSGAVVNKSMYCINMSLCLRSSCPGGRNTFQQTIGLPHY